MLGISIYAQNPYTIQYTIADGFPSNTVYSSFQDAKGFVWFTTDVGIVKYDGSTFNLLTSDDGLSDNEVFQMKEDSKGRKWLLTLNGLPSYIYDNKIYNQSNSHFLNRLQHKSLLIDFYEDKSQTIYLASRLGEVSIIKDSTLKKISIPELRISGVWSRGEELFALTTEGGIYNITNKEIKNLKPSDIPYRFFRQGEDFYFNNLNVLNTINSENKITEVLRLSDKTEILNVYKETSSKMWVCTRNGLYYFENNIQKRHFLKNNSVTSVGKDFEGNYWVTTLNNGIYLVPSFNVFQEKIKINRAVRKSKDEVWFGGTQNRYFIKKKNRFNAYQISNDTRKDNVVNIRFNNNSTYVIGKTGLLEIAPNKNTNYKIGANDILFVGDTLFVATTYLSKINLKLFNKDFAKNLYNNRLLNKRSNALSKDNQNNVYIGTNIGLYKYNSKSGIQFLGDTFSQFKGSINKLFFDKEKNRLLVATSSKGLIILENDKIVYEVTFRSGLNNNTITAIEKIENDSYLIGTNKGLNLIERGKNNYKVYNYNAALGFKNDKINTISYVNDTLYVATSSSLIYSRFNYFKERKIKPICLIDNIYADEKIIPKQNLLNIDYNNKKLTIKYAGISFLNKENLTFFYRLNNSAWSKTKETQVNYNSLNPSKYTFSIYAVNSIGEKSNIAETTFTIKKPFWRKWWFITLSILFISLLLFILIRFRLNYLKNQFKKERKALMLEKENILLENQMLALEQKALRLQMNPHFIFNALNTIKGYYSEGNVLEASEYISKFSKLLRLLLENTEQYIPLSIETDMLELYLSLVQVRYQYKFDYSIFVDKEIQKEETYIPTLLLQPLIENSVIHGVVPNNKKGKITVSFKKKNNHLICSVKDDGIGREASLKNKKHHKSKALEITLERLKLIEVQEKLHCRLEFVDLKEGNLVKGTEVKITIPIINYKL
jgi:ligand-binding sensor domain-containing protein